MNANQVSTGTILSSRYVLTEAIASGGMGEVWAATDTVLDRSVAIKLLHPALSQESGFVERFRAEARHTAALHHPNITTVFDYGEDAGTAFLVMELVAGQPLSRIISERAPLPAQETSSILIQAATALEAAHRGGVVHRDVKPANILITPDGTVKLTDFGIARLVDAVPMTRAGQILGTAQYLSPEQALGEETTGASDIYALGVVGYEMLTGRRPFESGTMVATALAHVHQPPPPLPQTVPVAVREVIEAALAKNPASRPVSAAAMARALGMPEAAFASDATAAALAPLVTAPDVTAPLVTAPDVTAPLVTAPLVTAAALPGMIAPAPFAPAAIVPAARTLAMSAVVKSQRSARGPAWLIGATVPLAAVGLYLLSNIGTADGAKAPVASTTSIATPSITSPSITSPSITSPTRDTTASRQPAAAAKRVAALPSDSRTAPTRPTVIAPPTVTSPRPGRRHGGNGGNGGNGGKHNGHGDQRDGKR